jgi:hypothetical protein
VQGLDGEQVAANDPLSGPAQSIAVIEEVRMDFIVIVSLGTTIVY